MESQASASLSYCHLQSIANAPNLAVSYASSATRVYTLYYQTNLTSGAWTNVPSQTDIPGSGGMDALSDPAWSAALRFYRVGVRLP